MGSAIDKVLEVSGFKELNAVQRLSVKSGLLERKNLVVAAPTASGKTLIAEIAALNILKKGLGKVVYMAPLVALASEKYRTFTEKYGKLGIKVAMSVGDYDSSDPWLAGNDLIICTTEKLDSLVRHGVGWIKNVGLVVIDEVHMLNDVSRGPTLEITMTRLREIVPNAQVLALSATIHNVKELAEWMKAEAVVSDWRPVKLYAGTSFDSKINLLEKQGYELDSDLEPEASIVDNTLKLRKQAIFFVANRRSAENLAEKLGKTVRRHLAKNELEALRKLANEIETVLEVPTRQCRRLAQCVRSGSVFHHAGLLHKQKSLIEDNFRNGLIKIITATPTIAYGVNLPAFRVVMRDLKRYYPGIGAVFLPVLEVHQMLGRCGRPEFDSFGEGILMAKSEEEAYELVERYIRGEPEDIYSKLAVEPVLRMHVLALIASDFCRSEKSLLEFFSKTFYAFQYGRLSEVEEKILEVLDLLVEWEFIVNKNGKLTPTRIGRRVSELYIDPHTANYLVECLGCVTEKEVRAFSFLQTISNSIEMKPQLSVKAGEADDLDDFIAKNEEIFLQEIPEEWDFEYDDFARSVKTAQMLDEWIEEATEDQILTKFRVAPGELRGRLHNADWLIYALQELALLLGYREALREIRKTRIRLKYGVKDELIPLVRLKNIGRMRARRLFNSNLKKLSDLRKVPLETLSSIIGPRIAFSVKEQLGEKAEKPRNEKQTNLKKF